MWRAPSYTRAYIRAAEALVTHARTSGTLDELGLPIFYLQRHALELVLKQLLHWVHEVNIYRSRRGGGSAGDRGGGQTPVGLAHTHAHLFEDLAAISGRLVLPAPPEKLKAIVRQMEGFETATTWSRCSESVNGGAKVRHVEDEVALPVVDLQRDLEAVEATLLHDVNDEEKDESHLYFEWLDEARAAGDAG
ncbi:MAG: hypothetical protein K2Y02_10580 [Burkholderiaceae bacterium]|nr:hypothetical protein [Burkholderiaceae bacterium]